jgi:type VI secretion system protein ImpC
MNPHRIELGVEPEPERRAIEEAPAAEYLVIGDFGCEMTQPVEIDLDNFDAVMEKLNVKLAGARMRSLDDFHPDRLYLSLDLFREFRSSAPPPEPEPEGGAPAPDVADLLRSSSLLERMVTGGDPFENYLKDLARRHAAPRQISDPAREAALCERMRGILHHPRFQAVEAAWRGLDFVLRARDPEFDGAARICIAHFPKQAAAQDLLKSDTAAEMHMFTLLNARKWRGVIGLYSFGPDDADIEFLGRMGVLAADARAPFVAEGSPDMGPAWDQLRGIPEASFIGLALPRILLRLPYGQRTSAIDSFPFEEMPSPPVHKDYLWANPALACLALVTSGPGVLHLEGLPLHTYQHGAEWTSTPCAEVAMTEAQVLALIEMGMMPLISDRGSDCVRLAGFRAINGDELPLGG